MYLVQRPRSKIPISFQSGLECHEFAFVLLARVYKQKDPEIPPMMRSFDYFSLSPQTFSSRKTKRISSVELRFVATFASQPSSCWTASKYHFDWSSLNCGIGHLWHLTSARGRDLDQPGGLLRFWTLIVICTVSRTSEGESASRSRYSIQATGSSNVCAVKFVWMLG